MILGFPLFQKRDKVTDTTPTQFTVKTVMIEPLAETEILCKEVVTALSSPHMQNDWLIMMKSRVESLLPKILESKNKMMLKSPKGRELAAEALMNVIKLHGLIKLSMGGSLKMSSIPLGCRIGREPIRAGVLRLVRYGRIGATAELSANILCHL